MNPWPAPKSVLVMDNCSIHHLVMWKCFVLKGSWYILIWFYLTILFRGIPLYYLPPYSLDLNPIEESFSYLKAHLRRNDFTFRATLQGRNEAAIHHMFKSVFAAITPELASAWMAHSGYIVAVRGDGTHDDDEWSVRFYMHMYFDCCL